MIFINQWHPIFQTYDGINILFFSWWIYKIYRINCQESNYLKLTQNIYTRTSYHQIVKCDSAKQGKKGPKLRKIVFCLLHDLHIFVELIFSDSVTLAWDG